MTVAVAERPAALVPRHLQPISRTGFFARRIPMAAGLALGLGSFIVWSPVDPVLTAGAMWAGLIAWIARTRGRARAILRETEEAHALLQAGDVGEAERRLDTLGRRARGWPVLHCLVLYHRAAAALRAGQIPLARELLTRLLDTGWLSRRTTLASYQPLVYAALALCESLDGAHEAARAFLAQAHRVTSPARTPMLLPADAVVLARAGDDLPGLLARLDAELPRAENLLSMSHSRIVRLIRAFLRERLERESYRAGAGPVRVEDDLALLRSAPLGNDHILRGWPELADFAARHGLAAPAPTPDPTAEP